MYALTLYHGLQQDHDGVRLVGVSEMPGALQDLAIRDAEDMEWAPPLVWHPSGMAATVGKLGSELARYVIEPVAVV